MTETIRDARKFGGLISISDFNTSYEGHRGIAEQIISDWKFDRRCINNIKTNLKNREYINR